MGRYISVTDVQDALELGTLTDLTSPKLSVVEGWIEGAEAELDNMTNNQWDLHDVVNEPVHITAQTNIFYTADIPLNSITSLEYNNGNEWNESWITINSDDYKISNSRNGKFKTKKYYYLDGSVRISYSAGYATIPQQVKELALLLVEKRYIDNQLAQSATDSDVVSVATIRITDKTKSNLEYRLIGLQAEIDNKVRNLGRAMKSKNYNFRYIDLTYPNI